MAVEMRKRHQRPVGAFAFGQNREAVLIAQRLALAPDWSQFNTLHCTFPIWLLDCHLILRAGLLPRLASLCFLDSDLAISVLCSDVAD